MTDAAAAPSAPGEGGGPPLLVGRGLHKRFGPVYAVRGVDFALSADRYVTLGRALKQQGRFADAKTAWLHALDLLTEWNGGSQTRPARDQEWCDCANDLAWLLATVPDSDVRDPAVALELAAQATEVHPECGTYWNTRGAAHYRAGDFEGAITALERAVALGDGGTGFDHVFLAMAYAQLGDQERAQHWLAEATLWMEHHDPGHAELLRLCEEARSILPAGALTSAPVR